MKLKKTIALLLILVMALSLAACGGKNKVESDIVAKVGNEEISQSQLDQYMYLYAFLQGIDLSQATDENMEYIKSIILEDYIALKTMGIYYADNETVFPEDYETEVDSFIDTVTEDETASAYFEKYNISEDFLRDFYINQYYSAAFFEELQDEVPAVEDADVREYYDENPDQFKIDEITAKHILVEEESLAEDLLKDLKEGADFSELAKEHSIDGSAENGGDLGTFGRNRMVPEFEEAAFALEPGELSDVVKTQFGYHIILVTDKNQGTESFENAEGNIRTFLKNQALSTVYMEKINELRDEYGVEYA